MAVSGSVVCVVCLFAVSVYVIIGQATAAASGGFPQLYHPVHAANGEEWFDWDNILNKEPDITFTLSGSHDRIINESCNLFETFSMMRFSFMNNQPSLENLMVHDVRCNMLDWSVIMYASMMQCKWANDTCDSTTYYIVGMRKWVENGKAKFAFNCCKMSSKCESSNPFQISWSDNTITSRASDGLVLPTNISTVRDVMQNCTITQPYGDLKFAVGGQQVKLTVSQATMIMMFMGGGSQMQCNQQNTPPPNPNNPGDPALAALSALSALSAIAAVKNNGGAT